MNVALLFSKADSSPLAQVSKAMANNGCSNLIPS